MHDWNSTDLERMLGQATWEWDAELGMHIPVCSRWKINGRGNVIRCGNGPLAGDQIDVGTCSEGPHLNTHEFDGHRPGV
jgi:hypothetical protein